MMCIIIVINERLKCLPGILYQTEGEGKRARQRRDRKRECVRDRDLQRGREREMTSAIK
jgi:hypothetical protein